MAGVCLKFRNITLRNGKSLLIIIPTIAAFNYIVIIIISCFLFRCWPIDSPTRAHPHSQKRKSQQYKQKRDVFSPHSLSLITASKNRQKSQGGKRISFHLPEWEKGPDLSRKKLETDSVLVVDAISKCSSPKWQLTSAERERDETEETRYGTEKRMRDR